MKDQTKSAAEKPGTYIRNGVWNTAFTLARVSGSGGFLKTSRRERGEELVRAVVPP